MACIGGGGAEIISFITFSGVTFSVVLVVYIHLIMLS